MKKWIDTFNKMRKDPKGKIILFFGFYLFFFFFVIVFVRNVGRDHTKSTDYEKGSPYSFQFTSFINENYHYSYDIVWDGDSYYYEGKQYLEKQLFTYQNVDYYKDQEHFFVKKDLWEKSENPYLFSDFLTVDSITLLLKNATYESKTSYESGKTTYTFLISTDSIHSLLFGKDTDLDLENNTIIISEDENGNIDGVSLYLDSYCVYNKLCNKSLKINMRYKDFGDIQEIESPI